MKFELSDKFINYYFSNSAGELLKLKYQLYNHSLRDDWMKLMKENNPTQHIERGGHFYGRRFTDINVLEDKINHCIRIINHYAKEFKFPEIEIPLVAKIPLTVEFLNEAHGYFEKIDHFKKLKMVDEIRETLVDFNIAIHQAEQFTHLGEYPSDHIQVLMVPVVREELKDEHYQLFDPDISFGEMYLSYGMTGVPTKEAFIHQTGMVPQHVYSTGMNLCFIEDLKFQFREELNQWLLEKGKDPADPRLAIGSIPLGKLVEPVATDHQKFLSQFLKFNKVVKIEFEEL